MMRLILLFLALFVSESLFAWQVVKLKGVATAKTEGRSIEISEGQDLAIGTVVKTGRRSKLKLSLGTSVVTLGSKTILKLASKPSADKKGIVDLVQGKLRAIVNKPEAKAYRFKTKTASAGVRGTEFYIQSKGSEDRFCTLEGEVSVTLESGEEISVPAGKGLRVSPGLAPKVVTNNAFFVDQWLADTSLDEAAPTVEDSYSDTSFRLNGFSKNSLWFYGAYMSAFGCYYTNQGLMKYGAKDSKCAKAYIAPYIQYGVSQKVFIRPAVNAFHSNPAITYDVAPVATGGDRITLTLGEVFYEGIWDEFSFKLGLQQLHWNEGVLLSNRWWSSEIQTYLGAKASVNLGEYKVELLAVDGHEDGQPLEGINQFSYLGARVHFPFSNFNMYGLYVKAPEATPSRNRFHSGREAMNFGLFYKGKMDRYDVQSSVIYQKHASLIKGSRVQSVDGTFTDLQLGYTFLNEQPLRVSLRHIVADKDFTSFQHDYYYFGISHLVQNPANLTQLRVKTEWKFQDNSTVFFEWLRSEQLAPDGYFNLVTTTKELTHIGDELNLVYRYKPSNSWTYTLGAFAYYPDALGSKESYGFLTRLEYQL